MSNVVQSELLKQIEKLKAENDALKTSKHKARALSFKVTEKGAISVYGLQRFPVTLYFNQWTKLIDAIEMLKKYAEEHKDKLSVKESA